MTYSFYSLALLCLINFFSGSFLMHTPSTSLQDTIAKDTIPIQEVLVDRKKLTPLEVFEKKKEDFRIIYLLGDNKNIFSLKYIVPFVFTINLNKLYNHFSKSGRQARKLQRFFEDEYEDDLINEIWLPYTEEFSKLKSDSLRDFRVYYKPKLEWIQNASHYERIYYIASNVKNYKDSATIIRSLIELKR